MTLFAALIYWVIVALWLFVLMTVAYAYWCNPRTFGAVRLLLSVVAIDTVRNLVENIYFGFYFGAQYGLFPGGIVGVLGRPELLILPKIVNVGASLLVLSILLLRWLPNASGERNQADAALSAAEQRFKLLVDGVREYAIYLLDPEGRVTSWNSGAERIKHYTAEEIVGSHFSRFYTAEDQASGAPEQALASAKRHERFEANGWRVRKDGTTFWASVAIDPIRSSDGELLGFAKVTKDITDQRRAEETLKKLALFDQLTGLPNRVSLLRDLAARIDVDGSRVGASITLFNLDHFKDINDTLGQDIGDRILCQAAERLNASIQGEGPLYCTGGDNFALISDGDPLVVTVLIEKQLKSLELPFELDGRRLFLGVSAGIAFAPSHGTCAKELIANADLALHEAKLSGGRRYNVFTPAIRAKVAGRQEIDMELRRAFSEGEFVLFYQPQIRLSDSRLIGAEALLRWQHPTRGLLAPAAFIEALCASPVAVKVGSWILQSACEQAAEWRAVGLDPIRMGVNLFPAQFHDPGLLAMVEGVLRLTATPPELLELEITENIALGRDEATLETLHALRQLGIELAFDDFGTGYASLSYLTRYPLTRIKIDRSFVSKIGQHSPAIDTAVVRSMITMAHNLNLNVIAEGVETESQAAFLRGKKCEEAQGYLYSRPVSADEFTTLLQKSIVDHGLPAVVGSTICAAPRKRRTRQASRAATNE